MIETYSLSHKGGQEKYVDDVLMKVGKVLSLCVIDGSVFLAENIGYSEVFQRLFSISEKAEDFSQLCERFENEIPKNTDFILLRATDDELFVHRHGKTRAYIVKNGEIKLLANGVIGVENDDRIIVGTDGFYDTLTREGVLADALTADSCEEWMDYVVHRISDVNMLTEANLTAVTLIVRSSDDFTKTYTPGKRRIIRPDDF